MKYSFCDGNLVLNEYDSFVISQTLECGQCFRFEKIGDEDYIVIAKEKILQLIKRIMI